jgi:AraC-like DNA-binding protein
MPRIRELMDRDRLFLQSELKVADVAALLGTNVRYVSDCINQQEGCSFSQFVNGYRIDYAKKQLRDHPDKKIASVAYESGFANETSFFRAFKALTGMTPREWVTKID